jgi:hypothetical protein
MYAITFKLCALVVFFTCRDYCRPMTVFRRTSQENQSGIGRSPADVLTRLVRIAGRVLLWGCVLLLLVRGALSLLSTDTRTVTKASGVTVTVTQPARAETSQAQGK